MTITNLKELNTQDVVKYIEGTKIEPFFIWGDSQETLCKIPNASIDCILTSPPYWNKRQYQVSGIGLETSYQEYIANLMLVFKELHRVLKPTGSFWLNIGDTYKIKKLLGIPWRLAIAMKDNQNWIMRDSVIWNKHKGAMDSSKDRLRNIHENIFHFVKDVNKYYFDADAIRHKPRESKVLNGAVVTATGVSGIRYKRQIELSTSLTSEEKMNAMKALGEVLLNVNMGIISDFRMIIRDQQRTTHSDSPNVSGRAKELQKKGFYFLFYNKNGSLPGDVWDILPEDTQKRSNHYAVFPEDLCKIPILSTCPLDGVVLDPFCGTGTTSLVAYLHKRKSIGIDISREYLEVSQRRLTI